VVLAVVVVSFQTVELEHQVREIMVETGHQLVRSTLPVVVVLVPLVLTVAQLVVTVEMVQLLKVSPIPEVVVVLLEMEGQLEPVELVAAELAVMLPMFQA
jgi:hypothetical protein